jgi:hypothetical protein
MQTVVRKIPQRVDRFGMMYEGTPVGGAGRIKVNQSVEGDDLGLAVPAAWFKLDKKMMRWIF